VPAVAPDELRSRVDALAPWHYEFELGGGVVTPIGDPSWANRHRERKRYFFDPVVGLLGGLEGKRILDLGSNGGFWSLAAIEAGADFVCGIEGRPELIEQARLVFEAKGVAPERYSFVCGNVYEVEPPGPFDVVLCLGLLYHVNRPFELFLRMAEWNTDVLVVDTQLALRAGPAFEVLLEPTDNPRHAIDYELVLFPTRAAVVELARAVGYGEVAILPPRFESWTGAEDFRDWSRRAFVCSKQTSLAGLDREPVGGRRYRRELLARRGRWLVRSLRRAL
jgi:SAM-dependent methyltransferase